jgi:PIN domain nuclease of toxin-antitoxin system
VTLVLDTNALLWLSGGSDRLGPHAQRAIQSAIDAEDALFSAISVWETAMLVHKARYTLGQATEAWRADLLAVGLREAPLDGLVAALAVSLTGLSDDPADRFIAALSLRLGAKLVTSDAKLLAWAAHTRGAQAIDAKH